jgi:F0F1-type ATP synthase alpha subunit
MKQVAGTLRLERRNTARWRPRSVWFRPDAATRSSSIAAPFGRTLKQGQYQPETVEQQVLIYAGTNGFASKLTGCGIEETSKTFFLLESKHADVFADILKKRELDGDLRGELNKVLEEFKGVFKV